ncbi:MAG: tetratricopeptide repeat protein [Candidatus Kapabacteria bacterium]|nr:tetratricopeptide repeat protein [Candidatus Kapabacteria bacterium]
MSVSPLFAVEAEELIALGKPNEAIKLIQEGLGEYPKYPSAFGILAKAYKMIGNEEDANEILESAVYTFPQSKTLKALLDPNVLKQPKEFNIEKAVAKRQKRFHIQEEVPISTYFTKEVNNELDYGIADTLPIELNLEYDTNEKYFNNEEEILNPPTYISIKNLGKEKLNFVINSKSLNLIPFVKNSPEFYFPSSNSSLFQFIEYPEFELPILVDSFENELYNHDISNFENLDDSIETYNTILANRDLLEDEIDFIDTNTKDEVILEDESENEEIDNSINAYNTMLLYNKGTDNLVEEDLNEFEVDELNDTIGTFNTILANRDLIDEELADEKLITSSFENKEINENNFSSDLKNDESVNLDSFEQLLGIDLTQSDYNNSESKDVDLDELENLLNFKDNEKVADVIKEIIKADVGPRMSLEELGEELSEFSNHINNEISDIDDFATETLAEIYIDQGAYPAAIEIFKKLVVQMPENKSYYLERINLLEKNL